jgi:hypothetical protein
VTAPDGLRAQLRALPLAELVTTAARLRPDQVPATPTDAAKFALRPVAGRWLRPTGEVTELDVHLERLVAEAAAALVAVNGVGTQTAAALLPRGRGRPTAAAQPGRVRALVWGGADPGLVRQDHPASAGPWRQPAGELRVVPDRGRPDGPASSHPRLGEAADHPGQDKAEIIRCLKRYVAREPYAILTDPTG